MSRQALLVIDMLADFLEETGSLYCGEGSRQIVPRVAARIAEARQAGIPVIYICDQHRPDDPEFEMFPPHCLAGTPGGEVIGELAPRPSERVIPKRRYSGFFGTDLDLTLRELGVEEIWLVGVCTNICVLYTAADARMLNYRVTVFKDSVASFDGEAHAFALRELEKTLGARVV